MSGPVLTDHELRVLGLISLGYTHQEIAGELVMTAKGVTPTVNRAVKKLGASNAPHAVLLACRAGILDGRPRSQRHGDHGGYTQHQKRGEDACAACKAGEAAYQVERRLRRRQEGAGGAVTALEVASGAPVVPGAAEAAEGRSGDPGGVAA